MKDYLKARFYAYVHSRNLIVLMISMILWVTSFAVTIHCLGTYHISLYYGVWAFFEFYLCFIPVVVSSWYGNTLSCGYDKNIPLQTQSSTYYVSSVVHTYILNTILTFALLLLGTIICIIPNRSVVYINDPVSMIKLISILVLVSYARCSFVLFATEATGSYIWGAVLGMLVSSGIFGSIFFIIEIAIYDAWGIGVSSFPFSTLSTYLAINSIIPPFKPDVTEIVVKEFPTGMSHLWFQMLFYSAFFLGLTLVISKRKRAVR